VDERPVKLTARLPKGKANGLESVHGQLCRDLGSAYVIMEVGTKMVRRYPGGVLEPETYIARVEGLPAGALADDAARLMGRARGQRADAEKVEATEPSERLPMDLGGEDPPTGYEPGAGNGAGWND